MIDDQNKISMNKIKESVDSIFKVLYNFIGDKKEEHATEK